MNNGLRNGLKRTKADKKIPIRVHPRLSASNLFLFLLFVACQPAPTPAPTPTPPHTIEAGIAGILFDARIVLLDQRAEPYYSVKLRDDAEITNADNQPISLLDLKSGDVVRIEGYAAERDAFLAQRIVVVRAVAAALTRNPTARFTALPSATPRVTATPSLTPPIPAGDRLPLPGTLIIADSGNDRVIEVTNDKRVVWEFPGNAPLAPEQFFFAPDYATRASDDKTVIVNFARYHQVSEVDTASRKIIWTFGVWGAAAADDRHLNTPGSVHRLPDGLTVIADTRNCRVLVIGPDKRVAAQIGKTGECKDGDGFLNRPIGALPLPTGRMLITELGNRRVSEMDLQGKVYRSVVLANIAYLSEAQLTRAGNVLVAAYEKPGRITEIAWNGRTVWDYFTRNVNEMLDRPSQVLELPNGNIAFTDDFNHRVVIVNRAGKVLWQYGVTGVAGKTIGYLDRPSGLDFRALSIPAATFTALAFTVTPTRTATPTRVTRSE